MFIERTLTTSLETKDTQLIYNKDIKASLLELLRVRYNGRCFKRSYIVNVLEVVEHSPFICEWNRNGGMVRASVSFKVQAVIYDKFEVITDAKLIEITEHGEMIFKSKYAAIMLMNDPKLQKFKVGSTYPVRVFDARYIPYYTDISIRGIPFTPLELGDREYYIEIGDAEELKTLESQWAKLDEAKKTLAGADVKEVAKLEKLSKPGKTPAGFKRVELEKLVDVSGWIMRPEWLPWQSTEVLFKEDRSNTAGQPKTSSAAVQPKTKYTTNLLKVFINDMTKNIITLSSLASDETDEAWMELYN